MEIGDTSLCWDSFLSTGRFVPGWIKLECEGGGWIKVEGYLLARGPVFNFDIYSELEPLKPFFV